MLAASLRGSLGFSLVSYWLAKVPARMLCFAGYYRISLSAACYWTTARYHWEKMEVASEDSDALLHQRISPRDRVGGQGRFGQLPRAIWAKEHRPQGLIDRLINIILPNITSSSYPLLTLVCGDVHARWSEQARKWVVKLLLLGCRHGQACEMRWVVADT